MVRSHNLAKAISDCGWGMFCTMLRYKAENEGKTYIEVDRWFPSSKTCNVCLDQVGSLPLDVRNWTCECCQTTLDILAALEVRRGCQQREFPRDRCRPCGALVAISPLPFDG